MGTCVRYARATHTEKFPSKRPPQKNRQKNLTDLGVMCYNGYIGERTMFEIFQQDDGLVQRLKELKAYYKQKDEKEEKKETKLKDSILKRVFRIYPGM